MALKGNQKKLDKNNNNRIDAQDFKILKQEKAKGRFMGLQDESVKPGKVKPVKAVLGLAAMGLMGAKFLKDRKKKASKLPGGKAILPGKTVAEMYKEKMEGKKRGGGINVEAAKKFRKNKTTVRQFLKNTLEGKYAAGNRGTAENLKNMRPNKSINPIVMKKKIIKAGMKNLGAGLGSLKKMGGGVIKARVGRVIRKDPTATVNPADKGIKKAVADRALRAAKATKYGKIAAGVAGVGLAAKAYLNKKLKESKAQREAKGKMKGGFMKKYNRGGRSLITRGGGVDASILGRLRDIGAAGGFKPIPTTPKGGIRPVSPERREILKKLMDRKNRKEKIKSAVKKAVTVANPVVGAISTGKKIIDKIKSSKTKEQKSSSGSGGATQRGKQNRRPVKKIPVMETNTGGMMQRPMGYKKGTMIMARGCKLGRKKATKIT
jgi:hypothetical protein|tara:strand:+ start:228 stop:1529 length:1302 start_codon:yes stop_codon:yes gene_type:complete